MEKGTNTLIKLLSFITITGNIFFMLWITYNAIDEDFNGTVYEKVSYFALMLLLTLNLISSAEKQNGIMRIDFGISYLQQANIARIFQHAFCRLQNFFCCAIFIPKTILLL